MGDNDVIVISCLWCSDVSFISNHLYDYVQATASGVSDQHEQWVSDATQDLCNCSDCVDEYHRALEKAFQDDPRFTNELKELVYSGNVTRLEKCLSNILSKCKQNNEELSEEDEEDMMMFWSTQRSSALQREFECPMLEILKYPRLLLNRRVNELFVSALDEMETIDQHLEVHGKYPGVYLLLVHPSQKVRRWAMGVVQSLGQVDWDDYDSLEQVLSWIVTVITFDQFDDPMEETGTAAWDESCNILLLPKHLFAHESRKEFWIGVCMFITALSGPCIRSRLICNREDLVNAIVNALDCSTLSSEVFWPALQCLRTLLDKLGSRFWQFVPTNSGFDYVLKCILKSPQFEAELAKWSEEAFESRGSDAYYATNSQVVYDFLEEALDTQLSKSVSPVDVTSSVHYHRLPFTWIVPFLQSLLDFGEAAYKAINTLFHAVHSFPIQNSNLSPLFNESLFTLSQMVQLLFSKRAYKLMYRFKAKWLPAVKIALCSVKDISSLSSLKHLFNVLLGILDTDEAKKLPENKEVVSHLQKFSPSLKSPCHQRDVKILSNDNIVRHVTKVLEILMNTRTDPTQSFLSEQPELPAKQIKERQQQSHDLGAGGLDDIKVKLEPNVEDSPFDTSTFSGSFIDHRPSYSKVKSASPRKVRRVHQMIQTRKKTDVSSRKDSSSESTDELEDLEPPTQSHRTKRKCISVRQDLSSKVSRQDAPLKDAPLKDAGQKSPSRVFRQDSNVPYKAKIEVPCGPRVLFIDDDTTDDMDEDTKPIVIKSESEDDDNVFENVNKPKLQSSKRSSKSSPVPIQHQSQEPNGQKVQQSSLANVTPVKKDVTPVKKTLKLSLNRHRSSPRSDPVKVLAHTERISSLSILLEQSGQKLPQKSLVDTTPVKKASLKKPPRRLSTEPPLSSAEEPPLFMSNTLVQPHTTTFHQEHPSVATVDLSADEVKEFERFSDTETDDDVISILKQKRQIGKSYLASTNSDNESGSEPQGCYQYLSKKEKSVEKVHKWLDSSSEGSVHAENVIAQPDSQTDETIMQCDPTSSIEQLSSHPSTIEVCDTSDQQTKLSEPVSSSQKLRDIDAEQSKNTEDTSQLDKDKYTPESPSSTSSSLPPVVWEKNVHPPIAPTLTKPERSLEDRDLTRASCNQLQSALISTSSATSSARNQRKSSSNKAYGRKSTTSAIDVKRDSDVSLIGEGKLDDEIGSNRLDVQDTSEEIQWIKNNIHEQGIAAVSKEIATDTKEDSEPESMSIGSPMEVEAYPSTELPVSEDDITFEQAVSINENNSEASHELTVSERCGHSLSDIHHSSDDLVKESNLPIGSKTNEQLPTSMSPAHQTTRHLVEERKPLGRKIPQFTEVAGMTYSSQKATLKRKHLPDPSTSIQGPPAKTQSSGTSSLKQSNMNLTEQFSATLIQSLPEHHSNMQSNDASVTIQSSSYQSSTCKEIWRLPASSTSSVILPSLATKGKAPEYKGTCSHLSKKNQPSGTSTNTSSPSVLSPSTQNLLDSIGQPPSITSVNSKSKNKHPPSLIPAKKYVPLKPKILPKVDDLSREVLSWDPAGFLYPQQAEDGKLVEPTIQLKEDLLKVPSIEPFESFDHYLSTFKPLIFHELWNTIFSDIHDPDILKPDPAFGKILSVSRAGPRLQVIKWKALISRELAKSNAHPAEDDLVVVNFSQISEHVYSSALHLSRKDLQFRFALVESVTKDLNSQANHSRHDPNKQTQCVLVLTLKVSDLEFATTSELLDGSEVELRVVTSLKTVRRQWSGLINLHSSLLVRDIISPRGGAYFCCQPPGHEGFHYKSLVNKKYNDSQMTAIHSVVQAVSCSFAHPRICLLHGPPGTGKTHTISGMVCVMLNELRHSSNSHPTKSALPGQPLSTALKPTKPRILICTPSNNAIDEIIRKLIKDDAIYTDIENQVPHSRGSSCSAGKFNLVRIGKPERIHSELAYLSLDYQAKKLLAKNSNADTATDLSNIRSELQGVEAEVNKMEKRLHILELAYKNAPSAGPQIMSDIKQLKERLPRYKNKQQELSKKYKDAKVRNENIIRGDVNARKAIVMRADIICSTLSGSASSALRDCRNNLKFSCIIIDESSQCTELEALIPLKYTCSKLVLVGDPCQLQAVVKSKTASKYGYGQSLLKRLCEHFDARSATQGIENPVQVLKIQYRMCHEICDFPSRHFYNGQLKTDKSLSKESERSPFHPFLIFDVTDGTEMSKKSLENVEEANLVVDLVKVLFDNRVPLKRIGVITPYKAQVKRIQKQLKDRFDCTTIDVHTVDGFQGREKEFIIISCVRAQSQSGSIGFLSDKHRLNVAITRSKMALYVLGHLKSLKVNDDWRALIDHAQTCNAIVTVKGDHVAVVNRILKTRKLKNQVGGDHHQSRSSRVPHERTTASVHRQGNRHRSDSEVDRQHQKSFPEQRFAPHSITPTDPRIFHPVSVSTQQSKCAASRVSHQHDPLLQRPGASSSQVSGAPRRRTTDTANLSRVEHRHSFHKQVRIEPGVDQRRESSMSRLQQQRPTQLKLSTSTTSGHSKHVSPDSSPKMAGYASHSSLSPNQQCHANILYKGRKRVAHKSDEEIKSQRQEHKLTTPVSPTSDPAPPSKRPRIRSITTSGSKGGLRSDLLKKMTKK